MAGRKPKMMRKGGAMKPKGMRKGGVMKPKGMRKGGAPKSTSVFERPRVQGIANLLKCRI